MEYQARITELRDKRKEIDTEQRSALDKASAEKRGLNTEELAAQDRMNDEFNSVTSELRNLEQLVARDAELRKTPAVAAVPDDEKAATRSRKEILGSDEYRSAADTYMRKGMNGLSVEERSVLQSGVDADGGVTVAETWRKELIEPLREESVIRQYAEVITTDTGGDFHLPRVSANAAAVTIIAEGTTIPDDAEGFDEVVLKAWKYAKITKVNDEAVEDLGFDVGGFVSRRSGEDIGLAQGGHFALGAGVGSSQPMGLITASAAGVTTASPTAIVPDEVVKLVYSVTRKYRRQAMFLANDHTIAALRVLKDGNGNYMWQYGLQNGQPDTLAGYPIDTEPFMEDIAATKKVLGFGNINRAYIIRDVRGIGIKFLNERYADTGQVAWRTQLRSDGNVKDANAFKVLAMHA